VEPEGWHPPVSHGSMETGIDSPEINGFESDRVIYSLMDHCEHYVFE